MLHEREVNRIKDYQEEKEAEAFLESIQRDDTDHDPEFWEHHSALRQVLRSAGTLAEYTAYAGAGLRGGRAGFVVGGAAGSIVPGVGTTAGAAVGSVAGAAGAIYVTQEIFERVGGILGPHIQDAHAWLKKEYGTKTAESFMMNLEAVGALSAGKIVQSAKAAVAQSGKTWHYQPELSVPRAAQTAESSAIPAARSTAAPQSTVQVKVAAESALKARQVFAKHIMQKKEAKAVIKNAKQTAANGNAREVPGTELRTALREVEITTGRKITIEQKKQLIDYCLKNKQFEKLSVGEKAAHSRDFKSPAFKDKLIKDWEHMGGTTKVRDWPKYTKDVLGKDGKVIRGAEVGNPHQAHHIIPQQVKGPHAWWNMHPAPTPMHQEVLHGSASRLMEILRTLS